MLTFDVLLTKQPNNGYVARPVLWPNNEAFGTTEEEALQAVRVLLEELAGRTRVVQITVEEPEQGDDNPWLSFTLELSLAGFKTPTAETVAEVVDFLAAGPSPAEVTAYHVSERAQDRLRRLLALNEAGVISQAEKGELDEIERLKHILIMLKTLARERLTRQTNGS